MNSVDIGKYILSLCKEKGIFMNQTKLQKLMYIVYGAYMALDDKRMCDEQPRAWPFGPVFPNAQQYFANKDNFTAVSPSSYQDDNFEELRKNEGLTEIIKDVIDQFGCYSAKELSDWSHRNDSPWKKALDSNNNQWNSVISDSVINEYFSKHITRDDNE